MRYGVSKRCVTPRWPVYMAGYAKIKTRSEGIHDDLFVRTVLINGEDKSVLIISIDICYFPRTWADNVKDEITRFCGLKPEQILIQATHTHSGPRFSDKAGELSPEDRYSRFLKENILECVRQVFGYQCEGTIEYGSGVSYVGINRRMKTADGVKLAPNPAGPIDKNLSVIRIKNEQGQPVAILFNIACHATVLGGSNMLISADYPGVACNLIEAANGGCMALFMQGTCGDIDPRVLDCGQGLRNGLDSDFIDVDIAGRILAHDVIYICKNLKVIPEIKIRNAIDGTILPFEIKQKSFLEELSKKYENDDIWHAGWTVKVNAIIETLENGTYE